MGEQRHTYLSVGACTACEKVADTDPSLRRSNLRVVTEVARSLEFSSYVTSLADRIIHGMTKGGQLEYNAVHLRIEKDARDWSQIMGGEQARQISVLRAPPSCGRRCLPCRCTGCLVYCCPGRGHQCSSALS